jgi:hypothetical protein
VSADTRLDHPTIFRWVQHSAPQSDKRCRPQLKACNASRSVDEPYVKSKKTWRYLYRPIDSEGTTLEFLLRPTRDAEAAKGFFVTALHSRAGSAPQARPLEESAAEPMAVAAPHTTISAPRVSTVAKHAASPQTRAVLKVAGRLPEQVERETWSRTSSTCVSRPSASSNGWSTLGGASFPSSARGGPYQDLRSCT